MPLCTLAQDARLATELLLLKPILNVGRDELVFLRTAAVFHNGAELPGHTLSQKVIIRSPVAGPRSRAIVGRCRGAGLEVLVGGERLGDQPGADWFAIPIEQKTSVGLLAEESLSNTPEHHGIEETTDEHRQHQEPKV